MTRRAMAAWILVIAMAVTGPAAAQTTTLHNPGRQPGPWQ